MNEQSCFKPSFPHFKARIQGPPGAPAGGR